MPQPIAAAIGIDRFLPDNDYRMNGATRIEYGAATWERTYLLNLDGTLVSDDYRD